MKSPPDPLSLRLAERIDELCDRFEAAWRPESPPRIEDCLAHLPSSARATALGELLRVELELRDRDRLPTDEGHFRARFPEEAALVAQAFAERAQRPTTETSVSRPLANTVSLEAPPAPARTVDPSPQQIARFRVLALIGEGSFGQVFRARDPHLDRDVAIKVPRPGALANPSDIERFLREAKAAGSMQHPNICPVYEVGTADGRPYIVMALVTGKSLADHLKQLPEPMPVRQAALMVRKLAQALELAHAKGIVHRDLKPANILLDKQRKDVLVTDFGLARRQEEDVSPLTHSGLVLGSPAYMSPEQARGDGRAVGPASDVYSLGVILYELLTHRRPFAGSLAEVLGMILHVEPAPPSAFRPEVDPRLEAICLKAMAKDRSQRYASMRELADDLTAYLKERPSPAPTLGTPPQAPADAGATMTGSDERRMDDMFAALSADLRRAEERRQAKTEAAVRAAARQSRIPLWQWLIGAAMGGLVIVAGIFFFARTPTAQVLIHIDSVDLRDDALSFMLDGKAMTARELQKPIELAVGAHELRVYRGGMLAHQYAFAVSRDAEPRIELREAPARSEPLAAITPPPTTEARVAPAPVEPPKATQPPPAPAPVAPPADDWIDWNPSTSPSWPWDPENRGRQYKKYRDGVSTLDNGGIDFPGFKSKNIILRAEIKFLGGEGNVGLGARGHYAYVMKYNRLVHFGIGAQTADGFKDLAVFKRNDIFPDFFAFEFAAVNESLTVRVNGEKLLEARPIVEKTDSGLNAYHARGAFKNLQIRFP